MSDGGAGGGGSAERPPLAARTSANAGRAANAPRALLIQPPVYDFAFYDLFHQPHGLLRVGRWLEAAGYEVELLDCLDAPRGRGSAPRTTRNAPGAAGSTPGRGKIHREVVPTPDVLAGIDRAYARYGLSPDVIRQRMIAARPDVIMLTTGMTYWYPGVAEIGETARGVCPGVPVVSGGVYATLLPDHCARQLGSEHVVGGAADGLADVLRSLGLPAPEGPVPDLPSVRLRGASGRLRDAAVLRLQDGCPRRCAYCASGVLSPRVRSVAPGQVLDHVAEVRRAFGTSAFAFYDDALLHNADHAIVPFLEGVISAFGERTLSFFVPNAIHLESVTDEIAGLMFRAGFREIRFGLESMDPGFHAALDGKLVPGHVANAVRRLVSAGFNPHEVTAYVMIGVPGQEFRTVMDTLGEADGLGINVSLSEYSPVPQTPLFPVAQQESGLDLDGEPLFHNNSTYALLSGAVSQGQMAEARAQVRAIRARIRSAKFS